MELNGVACSLAQSRLQVMCSNLTLLQQIHHATDGGSVREEAYTSIVQNWFQAFIGSSVYCFHQLPTGGGHGTHKPDLHIVHMQGLTLFTIAINDFKKNDEEIATLQTHACAIDVFQANKRSCSVIIGLPMTVCSLQMWLYLASDGKLLAIHLFSVGYADTTELSRVLCVIYASVHSLAKKQITSSSPGMITIKCCSGDHRVLSCNCVICVDHKRVIKFYDTKQKPYLKPNVSLLQAGPHTLDTFCCGRILRLQYPYIYGNHKPKDLLSISDAIRQLNNIHGTGYVHGDIRMSNIVYGDGTATIIDFDFADLECNVYPEFYSPLVPERAHGAVEGNSMEQIHDRVSLYKSVIASYIYYTNFQDDILRRLIIGNVPLQNIIEELQCDTKYY